MSRLGASIAASLLLASCAGAPAPRPPRGDALDAQVRALMDEWQLPGGQLAIVRGDRVLIDRAYGLAAPGVAMQPRARMRIASVSKTFTAAAVHLLVAEGRLSLDEPALPRLHLGTPPVDPRWSRITVRQLLEHSAGFDRHESRDWTFESRYIARELGLERPPELREIVGFVARLPLDFEPGSDVAYSNLGYSILGLVIEDAAGMPYERFVTERLLAPSGLERIVAGRTRREQRPDDEVSYFPHESEALSESVFGGAEPVPTPDGGFYIEPMLAHGGWIASAVDVARFMTRLDALPEPADFFDAANLEGMIAPPTSHHVVDGEDTFYAHGLIVSRKVTTGDRVWLHDGSKPGTTSFAVRFEDGTVAVALFNGRPVEGNVSAAIEELLRDALRTLPPADHEEARRE